MRREDRQETFPKFYTDSERKNSVSHKNYMTNDSIFLVVLISEAFHVSEYNTVVLIFQFSEFFLCFIHSMTGFTSLHSVLNIQVRDAIIELSL